MEQSRRQLVLRGMGGIIVTALAACGPTGSGGQEAGTKPGGSGKQVTIRIGARAAATAGNPSWEQFMQAKQVFEAKHPKITLTLCSQSPPLMGCSP